MAPGSRQRGAQFVGRWGKGELTDDLRHGGRGAGRRLPIAQRLAELIDGDAILIAGPDERGAGIGERDLRPKDIEVRNGTGVETVTGRLELLGQQAYVFLLNRDLLPGQQDVVEAGPNLEQRVIDHRLQLEQ